MRLDLFLETLGYSSRKAIKRVIAKKQVVIDGEIILSGDFNVEPWVQDVWVAGEKQEGALHEYLLLHKPRGVVSAVWDEENMTVLDLLTDSEREKEVFPVGRLDKDTSGLLLLTNNGQLAYQLMHPQFHAVKKYEVVVNGEITTEDCQYFAQGVVFHDGVVCRPAVLNIICSTSAESLVTVEISEGKFHQVKKMFLCVGKKVVRLKRVAMGTLLLDESLAVGEYRSLQPSELLSLMNENKKE